MPSESTTVQIKPDAWIAAVQSSWQLSGHRITGPRSRVLRHITSYTAPFTAEQLYTELQQDTAPPGRATVYRTLEQLAVGGWVARIHTQSSETGYIVSWPGHLHHLVCTNCGRVIAFEGCALENLLASLARRTDFVIEEHLLQIYGRCAACRSLLDEDTV